MDAEIPERVRNDVDAEIPERVRNDVRLRFLDKSGVPYEVDFLVGLLGKKS